MKITTAAAAVAFAWTIAAGEPMTDPYRWDFEDDAVDGLVLTGAEVRDDDGVITGTRSLFADSRVDDRTWNEFIHTDPAQVPLRPDTAYTVSLRYRAIEPLGSERAFYLLFRSTRLGKVEGDRRPPAWNMWDGEVHRKDFVLRTGTADDYYLIVGIRGPGAILVDDLSIAAGSTPPEGRVASGRYPLVERLAEFRRLGDETGTTAWVDAAQVVIDPVAWEARRDGDVAYLARLAPDFALYLDSGRLEVRRLAVPRSGFRHEYQEFYKMEVDADEWPAILAGYLGNGLATGLDGEPYQDSTWAEGGYFMCHSAPRWHRDFLDATMATLDGRDGAGRQGIAQDNIGVPALWKGGFAFCPWCRKGFRRSLFERYSPRTLSAWGVAEPASLDVRGFILDHSLEGDRAIASPVVREYIRYYHRNQMDRWADCAMTIRRWASDSGRAYLVNGNLIGGMGPDPYPLLLMPWVDAVYMEHWWPEASFYEPPRFHGAGWGYKLADSAAGGDKAVWIENALTGPGGGARSLTVTELILAEGYANGGVRIVNTGANIPTVEGRRLADVPGLTDIHLRYARFARAHRGLLWGRRPAHRVAVLYSLPTHLYRRFPAIPSLDGIDTYLRFAAACILLERSHIPYDVVMLPHPELTPPSIRWAERLRECDLIVAPGVEALAPAQAEVLRECARAGASIAAFGPFATRDHDFNPADYPALLGETAVRRIPDWDLTFGRRLWKHEDDPEIAARVGSLFDELLPRERRQVVGEFPGDIVANPWVDRDAAAFSVHFLNYSWDPAADRTLPAAGFPCEIRVPDRFVGREPRWFTPGGDPEGAPLATTRGSDGRVRVEIPSLGVYGIAAWVDREAVALRGEHARAIVLGHRAELTDAPPVPGWRREVDELRAGGKTLEIRALADRWEAVLDARTEEVLNALDTD